MTIVTPVDTVLATRDARPFFERMLGRAVERGIIDEPRLATLKRDGAKGIVQLATYFGTPNLRPELESARARLVNLAGLALESASAGDVDRAAELFVHKSLLAWSKAGADALRELLALPADPVLEPPAPPSQAEKYVLSLWSLDDPMTAARYRIEKSAREQILAQHELSYWLAARLGMSRTEMQDMNESCEAVINSALLILFVEKKPGKLFSTGQFVALHDKAALKKKLDFPALAVWSEEAPAALRALLAAESTRFVERVLPLLRSRAAADFIPAEDGQAPLVPFFFDRAGLDELTHHDKEQERAWQRITAGKGEHPDVMCTVLLLVATGLEPRPDLRRKDAIGVWERYRSEGFDDAAVGAFIDNVVPFQYQSDVRRLWLDDLGPEARMQLDDDDAGHVLAYLHETCRTSFKLR